MLEASEALLAFDVPVPPEDPTLALLATVVDDLLGLTEVLVEDPEELLAVDVELEVADLLTEVATAEVVVLLAVVNVAVLEAVAVAADFAAAAAAAFAAAACCAAVKVVVAAAEKLAAPVMATNKQMTNELGINFIMTPSAG